MLFNVGVIAFGVIAFYCRFCAGTMVAELTRELKITTATIYNYVSPKGDLTKRGIKMVSLKK